MQGVVVVDQVIRVLVLFWRWWLNELVRPAVKTRRRQWHPTPVLLAGKSHGRRSLVGCSPWGH